jgi:hypothetical protein
MTKKPRKCESTVLILVAILCALPFFAVNLSTAKDAKSAKKNDGNMMAPAFPLITVPSCFGLNYLLQPTFTS